MILMQRPKHVSPGPQPQRPKPYSNSAHVPYSVFQQTIFPFPTQSLLSSQQMNKLLQHPQSHLPTDTPSGCFNSLFHCLLCGGTISTRSPITSPTPYSTPVSKKFVGVSQNGDQVHLLPDRQVEVQLPIVARLMGLETPVDMSWVPRKPNVDESFNRSRSVNSVDYLLHCSDEPRLLHRRVKTSLSFGEVPVGDFFVVCLESSKKIAQCDRKKGKDTQKDRSRSEDKTEGRFDKRNRVANACIKNESLLIGTKSSQSTFISNVEQNDQLKMGKTCKRFANRSARNDWKLKNDYYKKPKTTKSPSTSKETRKDVNISSIYKSRKQPKNMNDPRNPACPAPKSPASDRLHSSVTQRCKTKAQLGNVKPRNEEKRRSRKTKIRDESRDTFGSDMMMDIKNVIEQDLEMKRWNWENEAGFLYIEYLCTMMELGILDELVQQMIHDDICFQVCCNE